MTYFKIIIGAVLLITATSEWIRTDEKVVENHDFVLRLRLKAKDPYALDNALRSVSYPESSRYRQYLSKEEIEELVRPEVDLQYAKNIISTKFPDSVISSSLHNEYVVVSNVTTKDISRVFPEIELSVYRHSRLKNRTIIRSSDPTQTSIPSELKSFVTTISGLSEKFPIPLERKKNIGSDPGIKVTPPVIWKQYNMTDKDIGGKSSTSQGVAAFEDAEFKPQDVMAFQTAYNIPEVKFQVIGPNDGGYFGEAGLDTQYISASGRGVPSWFLSHEQFDMLAFCELVLNMTDIPKVVSISWGSGESEYDRDHMSQASECFQKMGLSGITVLSASGDQGTGKQGGLFSCKKFDPTWPASCPYVTAVGGTYLENGVESAWSGSGGGFSAVFQRPSYQKSRDAVDNYLSNTASLPKSSLFDSTGRALPDVSALATNFAVFSGGAESGTLTGTSAATPTFAGMLSVLNDELVSSGKPTLGFINPTLYANGGVNPGYDITSGNNKYSNCGAGFPAVKGWDAVSGFGTPSMAVLRNVLTQSSS